MTPTIAAPRLSIVEAQLALGQSALDRGEPAAALEWFRTAARAGDARAFNMVGRCHERGWGVPAAPARAARYYRKAANLGDGWALFNLADLHFRGLGVPRDLPAAYRLYVAASQAGIAKALNMLGLCHEGGHAVAADTAAARALFQAAGEAGDCWGAFNLARLLLAEGKRVEACLWLERALQSGFADFFRAMADALRGHPDAQLAALGARAAGLLAAAEEI